jgi:Xaa-Pro aminopeptidase
VSSLFESCAGNFKKEGIPFKMPHIGHGMGLEIHEYPMIQPTNHDPIREGMVLNIEPLLIDPQEKFGYHIEDLVVVTSDGRRVLTGTHFPMEIPLAGQA